MKLPLADLHLHTFHSDGTFSPEELVLRALNLKLSCISVTDHDTAAGLPAAQKAAGDRLEILPGIEMTALFRKRELHILGYGIRPEEAALSAFMARMHSYRKERIQAMISRLRAHGVEVSFEEVQKVAGPGTLGRPHLAEAILKKGIVGSLKEAFERYIGDRAPCFVQGATLTVPEAVEILRQAGGVAVLAHPYRLVQDEWIPELVACGIRGIEAVHSEHPGKITKKYQKIAKEQKLLTTGGSDCHGFRKANGPLIGSTSIPLEWVDRLKEAISGKG
ncbi:MAG: PHP domain-containing protein [Candidatus Omnitrophica bacterium]|nr:PHP domain-containing protein [Candidatus Omnitrophota bacterium]